MSTFYDAAVALLAGKKIEKSEADRIIELVREHTMRPELQELDSLRSRLEGAMLELENVQSTVSNMSYDFNSLERETDNAMGEFEEVREAINALAEALEAE